MERASVGVGGAGAGQVLVEWRCCRLGSETGFSAGREGGCGKGGPALLEDELSRRSQPGREGGPRPHSQEEPGPRTLRDPAGCGRHRGENGLHLG